jgi:hypothetical protein
MDWGSTVAMATTGAGAGAAQPIIDYILGFVFVIVGAGLVLVLLFKGIEALSDGHVGRFVAVLVLFMVVGVIIGSSRQIATAVTGFAGGATLTPDATATAMEVVGYLLGDLLWMSIAVGGWMVAYAWLASTRPQVRHGD